MYEPHRNTFAMGCLFLALVLIGMYLFATPSRSQEAPGCPLSSDLDAKLQAQFGETVTAGGVLGPEGFMYITTNPRTHTFTILVRKPDGTSCVVLGGEGFALAEPARMRGPGL